MPRAKRDIYRGRFDAGFDMDRDVDLAHLREVMGMEEIDDFSYDFYGLYCRNIIRIMLCASRFRGYPDDVKEDMSDEAMYDMLRARTKFDGERYPQATAPFNYLYRVGFHSFQHVLAKYYQMQNRMVAASQVGDGARTEDGGAWSDDIIDRAVTDWDQVKQHLLDYGSSENPNSPSKESPVQVADAASL